LTFWIVLDIFEYDMIGTTTRQSSLFYTPLARQAALLKDDLLDPCWKTRSSFHSFVRGWLRGDH
jgi:hypothetical protein